MQKVIVVVTLCLLALAALGRSTSKYQVPIITEVEPRQATEDGTSDSTSYDVSVKVDEIIYVVLYTQPLGELAAKYAKGHKLLGLVGKNGSAQESDEGCIYMVCAQQSGESQPFWKAWMFWCLRLEWERTLPRCALPLAKD